MSSDPAWDLLRSMWRDLPDVASKRFRSHQTREPRFAPTTALCGRVRRATSMGSELTGCAVRRVLRQRMEEEIARSMRNQSPLSFMLLDVDESKSVNDNYGHVVGDDVLASVGSVLQTSARSFDWVSRVGGDEIGALLPDTEGPGAIALAARMRRSLSASVEVHVTLSIGVSGLDRSTPPSSKCLMMLISPSTKSSDRDAMQSRCAIQTQCVCQADWLGEPDSPSR